MFDFKIVSSVLKFKKNRTPTYTILQIKQSAGGAEDKDLLILMERLGHRSGCVAVVLDTLS